MKYLIFLWLVLQLTICPSDISFYAQRSFSPQFSLDNVDTFLDDNIDLGFKYSIKLLKNVSVGPFIEKSQNGNTFNFTPYSPINVPVSYTFNLISVGISIDVLFLSKFYSTFAFANNTASYDDSSLRDYFTSNGYMYEAEPIIGDTLLFSLGYQITDMIAFETTYKHASYGYWLFLFGGNSILHDDVVQLSYSAVTAGLKYTFW